MMTNLGNSKFVVKDLKQCEMVSSYTRGKSTILVKRIRNERALDVSIASGEEREVAPTHYLQ